MSSVIDKYVCHLTQPSDNAQVVYSARQILSHLGIDEPSQYLIASAVSELSTNIIRYGLEGTITIVALRQGNRTCFEVIASDSGPGIADVGQALKENYSTGNGLGMGLPSVKRIMDDFEVITSPESGTTIKARKWID